MPGIFTSSSTRSGASRSASASPSWPVAAPHELVPFVFERHPQRVANGRFVVDDQDAWSWAWYGWRRRWQRGGYRSTRTVFSWR